MKVVTKRLSTVPETVTHDPFIETIMEFLFSNSQNIDTSLAKFKDIPRDFVDILRSKELIVKFRHYLVDHNDSQDTTLLFWMCVEALKTGKSGKQRQDRAQMIMEYFFNSENTLGSNLLIETNSFLFQELTTPQSFKKVNLQLLTSAQNHITRKLDDMYWEQFFEALPENIREKINQLNLARDEYDRMCGKKNRQLWTCFTMSIINFKKGIMEKDVYMHFKDFIRSYVLSVTLNLQKSDYKRQVICNKVIDIERVEADLEFFVEVEKYKMICEGVKLSTIQGNFQTGEEDIRVSKAEIIYYCFIESQLLPRVQINITADKLIEIKKLHDSHHYDWGMYHDAALNLFPVLIHFWRKFCLHYYCPTYISMDIFDSDKGMQKKDVRKSKSLGSGALKMVPTDALQMVYLTFLPPGIVYILIRLVVQMKISI